MEKDLSHLSFQHIAHMVSLHSHMYVSLGFDTIHSRKHTSIHRYSCLVFDPINNYLHTRIHTNPFYFGMANHTLIYSV